MVMGLNPGYLLKSFLLYLLLLQKLIDTFLNWFLSNSLLTSFHEKIFDFVFTRHEVFVTLNLACFFIWRIFLVEKNSVLCLLFTSFFFISHFVFRRQCAEFFLSQKFCQMKAVQNIKCYISKALGLVQVCAKICNRYLVKIQFVKLVKFIYSEKATKFCKISTNYLTGST